MWSHEYRMRKNVSTSPPPPLSRPPLLRKMFQALCLRTTQILVSPPPPPFKGGGGNMPTQLEDVLEFRIVDTKKWSSIWAIERN